MDWKAETCNGPDNCSVSKLPRRSFVVHVPRKVTDYLK